MIIDEIIDILKQNNGLMLLSFLCTKISISKVEILEIVDSSDRFSIVDISDSRGPLIKLNDEKIETEEENDINEDSYLNSFIEIDKRICDIFSNVDFMANIILDKKLKYLYLIKLYLAKIIVSKMDNNT